MRILLDTHAFLWFVAGEERFSPETRELIADVSNEVFLSIVSVWEIAIKHSLGKLDLGEPFEELMSKQLQLHEIQLLPLQMHHIQGLIALPHHHRDPFDRAIIVQAQSEQLPLVSRDRYMPSYDVEIIW